MKTKLDFKLNFKCVIGDVVLNLLNSKDLNQFLSGYVTIKMFKPSQKSLSVICDWHGGWNTKIKMTTTIQNGSYIMFLSFQAWYLTKKINTVEEINCAPSTAKII